MKMLIQRARGASVVLLAATMLPACAAGTSTAKAMAKPSAQAQLQKQVATLQAQVAKLQTQNAVLKAQLAQMSKSQMAQAPAQTKEKMPVPAVLSFKMKSLDGKDVDLSQYAGRAVMIVNTASKCGNTPQYEGLEALYKKYQAQGFVILGFPSNDFAGQEPGSDGDIAEFCQKNYGVTFPMFSKVKVKGEDKAPLYEFLTSEKTNPDSPGDIDWNFAKFLIGRDGKIAARFKAGVQPQTPEVVAAVEKALAPAA